MKKYFYLLLITFSFVFHPVDASAMGVGIYFDGASGSGSEDFWHSKADVSYSGAGFVMDTSPLENSVFNYRLSIGYEKYELDYTPLVNSVDMKGMTFINDFGFSVYSSSSMRIWLGPEVKFSRYSGDTPSGHDVEVFAWSVGLVMGFNIEIAPRAILTFKAGRLLSEVHGDASSYTDPWSSFDIDVSPEVTFFSVGMLFDAY